MALNAYLQLQGDRQGEIRGSVTQKGAEGRIMVIAAEHSLTRPFDAVRGTPTSRRKHSPFKVTKEVDRASPLLYSALVSGERLTKWELRFYGFSQETAEEQNHYTVTLSNSVIIEIASVMPNNKDPDLTKLEPYEVVSFLYQRIQWAWVEEGLTSEDDWADLA